MKNLVVAKYLDGRIVKGYTRDFSPRQAAFHIIEDQETQEIRTIHTQKLKAVFFVKTTTGNKAYDKNNEKTRNMYGKEIEVEFFDGEIIRGYTQVFHPRDSGFFLFPFDNNSNNERIFIVRQSTRAIRSIQ